MPSSLSALSLWLASNWFEALVAILSAIAAHLAAGYTKQSRGAGFTIWVFTNGVLAWEFWQAGNISYFLLFVFYELENIKGVYNNLIRK